MRRVADSLLGWRAKVQKTVGQSRNYGKIDIIAFCWWLQNCLLLAYYYFNPSFEFYLF